MPLFPGGAISIRNEVEVPNCPPSEKPCSSRAITMITGAATPTWA